jgi:hypothetical protein
MKLETQVAGDCTCIVVRELDSGFWAIYVKSHDSPRLILQQRAETEEHALLNWALQAATEKARELAWFA